MLKPDFRDERVTLGIKIAALGVLFILAPWGWLPGFARELVSLIQQREGVIAALFVVTTALIFAAILTSNFLKSAFWRAVFALMGIAGFAGDQIVHTIANQSMTFGFARVVWEDRAMAGGAVSFYGPQVLWLIPIVAFLVFAALVPPPEKWRLGYKWATIPVFAFFVSAGFMHVTKDRQVSEVLPSPVRVPAQFVMAATTALRYRGPRRPVDYAGTINREIENIVFIVDESVRGDYLGINNPNFAKNMPFMTKNLDGIANFGVATASHNCSRGARYVLRTGLQETQLPDSREEGLRQPSMWQYAHAAGFKTYFIDAFSGGVGLMSHMNDEEHKAIDTHINEDITDVPNSDERIAARVNALLDEPGPKFIFIEKYGIHSPYDANIPAAYGFEPFGMETLSSKLTPEWRSQVRTYLQGLHWRVDRFFEKTLTAFNRPNTLMIYTSDHGQSMYDGGYVLTHCNENNPVVGEGLVPIFAATGHPGFSARLKSEAAKAKDRLTHFDIFPALLLAMGYDEGWISKRFPSSLFSADIHRKRRFLSTSPLRINARWISVP